jgi:hypothetical protein
VTTRLHCAALFTIGLTLSRNAVSAPNAVAGAVLVRRRASVAVRQERARAIADSVAKINASGPQDPVWSGFASSTVAVRLGNHCLTALALSWDGLHRGAIVILDSGGAPLYADANYRDASHLMPAGEGRIGFRYNSVWGSGIWETRFIVLCALSADVWDECLNVVLDKRTYATGYPPDDSLASRAMSLEQTGQVKIGGDTVFLTRHNVLKRSDEPKPRVRDLGTVRLLLP